MTAIGASFVSHVGQRLVHEFGFSAGASHPTLKGAAKEYPARVQLEKLLPEVVSVGSGMVIDSYGGKSKQQDIVVYERICPKFCFNETAEATFFPVEGVCAVGEVKSRMTKSEIWDAAEKSASVKMLTRHAVPTKDALDLEPTVPFRIYGSTTSVSGTKLEEFNQAEKSLHQVFTFAICEEFGQSPQTTLKHVVESSNHVGIQFALNMIVSLKDGCVLPLNSQGMSLVRAAFEADAMIFSSMDGNAFSGLLKMLRNYVLSGRTVERSHFERYFDDGNAVITIDASHRF